MIGKDQPESTRIFLKHQLFDQWWAAWVCKESLTLKAKCHASEGEAPSPCYHPASCHILLDLNCDFAGCYSTYCRLSSFVVSCHVKDLASGIDIVASFNKECKQGEKVRRGYILYCCVKIKNGKWLEPRSCVLEWNLVSRVKWFLVLTDVSTS